MARKKPPRNDVVPPVVPYNAQWGTNAVAEILQANPSTVVRWTKVMGLKFFRTPGGHRRFDMTHLDAFLRHHDMPVPYELTSRP